MEEDFLASRRAIAAKQAGSPEDNPEPHHVSYDERVVPQPRASYVPPAFFRKTATVEQYAELESILEELWSLNELFAKERTREAEIYLHWSGQTKQIRQRMMAWCRSYGERRLGRIDPKDQNNKFKQFHRVIADFHQISLIFNKKGSLDYLFSKFFCSYAEWLVFEGTFKHYLTFTYIGRNVEIKLSGIEGYCRHCLQLVEENNFHRDIFAEFNGLLRSSGNSLGRIASESQAIVELKMLATDLMEMRPYFITESRSETTTVSYGPGVWLAWKWISSYPMAFIVGATTEEESVSQAESNQAEYTVLFDDEGRITDPSKPWLRMGVSGLAENLLVLNCFHDRLLEAYDRIDFASIRKRGKAASESDDPNEEPEEVFALSCQDLAERIVESEQEPRQPDRRRRIGLLRMNELLSHLSNTFGCESRQGKGSEINVYRPGTRMFTLGSHGKNPEVPSAVVRRLLRRLEIPERDWLRAVYV